jgi:hypothetical protein
MKEIRPFPPLYLPRVILILLLLSYTAGATGLPVTFEMQEPGYVTIVIEDLSGKRVRNLIQDTFFEVGRHSVNWDLFDEGEPVNRPPPGGNKDLLYDIERHRVPAGTYQVRALTHKGLDLVYELSVQSPGNPAWHTPERTGGWLADHSNPADIAVIPHSLFLRNQEQLFVASPISEAGYGLVWMTLECEIFNSRNHVGRGGSMATAISTPKGVTTDPLITHWTVVSGTKIEDADKIHLVVWYGTTTHTFDFGIVPYNRTKRFPDLTVYRDTVVIATPEQSDELIFVDGRNATAGQVSEIRRWNIPGLQGIHANEAGELYVMAGTTLRKYSDVNWTTGELGSFISLIDDLEHPRRIKEKNGELFISDWGDAHQIKVFSPSGEFKRAIGKASDGRQQGLFDETRMQNPLGFDIDSSGTLWLAEASSMPKRFSKWNSQGSGGSAFIKAYYGPPRYAGNGYLDPVDPSRYYYAYPPMGTIEFSLDWENRDGNTKPTAILYNKGYFGSALPEGMDSLAPYYPIVIGSHRFITNSHGTGNHNAEEITTIWKHEGGRIYPISVFWSVQSFFEKLKWDPAAHGGIIPKIQADILKGEAAHHWYFLWTNEARDGVLKFSEMQFAKLQMEPKPARKYSGLIVNRDLSMINQHGVYLPAPEIDADGVPRYDLSKLTRRFLTNSTHMGFPVMDDEWFISANAPIEAFSTATNERIWTYQDQFHRWTWEHPFPRYAGEIVSTQQILGPVRAEEGEAGGLIGINSYFGAIHLMTTDGLYVTTILGDQRTTPLWRFSRGEVRPGDSIGIVSPEAEHFETSMTSLGGEIYVVAGKEHSSVVRVEGLEHIKRIDLGTVEVATTRLSGVEETRLDQWKRQFPDNQTLLLGEEMVIDGNLEDWDESQFFRVHHTANRFGLSVQIHYEAAISADSDYLYAAWRSGNANLLSTPLNAGEIEESFVVSGGLDLYLRTDPATSGADAGAGDVRVFITETADGSVLAGRYEKEATGSGYTYSSPIGEVTLGSVVDISDHVHLGRSGGNYEIAIPLSVLGLNLRHGESIKGDIGVIEGTGSEAVSRLYWANKNDVIVDDIYKEADYSPANWGTFWVKDPSAQVPDESTPAEMSYATWKTSRFGALADSSLASSREDPDGDGLTNAEEYAMNLDPLVAESFSDLRKPFLIEIDGSNWLALVYRFNREASDVSVSYEGAIVTPNNWIPLAVDGENFIEEILDPDLDNDGSTELRRARLRRDRGQVSYLKMIFTLSEP